MTDRRVIVDVVRQIGRTLGRLPGGQRAMTLGARLAGSAAAQAGYRLVPADTPVDGPTALDREWSPLWARDLHRGDLVCGIATVASGVVVRRALRVAKIDRVSAPSPMAMFGAPGAEIERVVLLCQDVDSGDVSTMILGLMEPVQAVVDVSRLDGESAVTS